MFTFFFGGLLSYLVEMKRRTSRCLTCKRENSHLEMEGNDQESIQLPNTVPSKTPEGKKDALKITAPQSKPKRQKSKLTVSSQKMAKRLSKIKKKNHQDIHTKTYNDRYSKKKGKRKV